MSAQRLFLALASLFGLGFALITPPCYVPDEVAHFWRAVSIAHGTWKPVEMKAPVPKGYQLFVFCVMHGNTKVTRDQMRTAWTVAPKADEMVPLPVVPSSYSPANYLPQIGAAFIGRVTGARPMIVFYLGRLFALAAFVAMVFFAIRSTPFLKWGFCAAGLLPMTLFMAGSWSADSMTIGLAFLVTALALREGRGHLAAFLLGLCKPVNFLVAFASRRWTMGVAALLGFGCLALVADGPAVKWDCITGDPLRFARIVAADYASSTAAYAEQMVGRLGQLDVILPAPVIWIEWLLLALLVVTAGEKVPRVQRILALAVSLALMLSVSTWMYLTWTPGCDPPIRGIQGRYYLPLLPLLLVGLSNPWWPWRKPGVTVVATVAVIANAFAVAAVAIRYFAF